MKSGFFKVRQETWPSVTMYENKETGDTVCLCDLSNVPSQEVLKWVNEHGLLDACLTDKGHKYDDLIEGECYDGEDVFDRYTFQGRTHTCLMPEGHTKHRWESYSEADMYFQTIGPFAVVVFDENAIPDEVLATCDSEGFA